VGGLNWTVGGLNWTVGGLNWTVKDLNWTVGDLNWTVGDLNWTVGGASRGDHVRSSTKFVLWEARPAAMLSRTKPMQPRCRKLAS
jgi:hypothetical protein